MEEKNIYVINYWKLSETFALELRKVWESNPQPNLRRAPDLQSGRVPFVATFHLESPAEFEPVTLSLPRTHSTNWANESGIIILYFS